MPTLTLSWTDLALMALTAGLIGGIVLVGRTSSQAGSLKAKSHQKKGAAQSKKKKKTKALPSGPPTPSASSAVVDPHHHPPTSSPPSLSVPAQPVTAPEPTPAEPPSPAAPSHPVDPAQAQSQAAKKKKGAAKKEAQSISREEFPPLTAAKDEQHQANQTHKPKRPFAERHQPPVRKTIVDDMIDPDVQKPHKMARVMNIVGPEPEDSLSPASEAEDGWEKVPDSKRSRATGITISIGSTSAAAPSSGKPKPTTTTASSSEQAPSKRQRQNARKKEAAKALKLAQEADRLSHLSAHKREQERLRMNAQTARSPHPTNATSPKPSGKKVASASIAEDGRLIWE